VILDKEGLAKIRGRNWNKVAARTFLATDIRDLLDTIESLRQPCCPRCGLTFDAGPAVVLEPEGE